MSMLYTLNRLVGDRNSEITNASFENQLDRCSEAEGLISCKTMEVKYKASTAIPKRKLKRKLQRVSDDDDSEDEVRLRSLGYSTPTPFPQPFAGLHSPPIFLARWSIQHPFEVGWRVCECASVRVCVCVCVCVEDLARRHKGQSTILT